MHTVLIVEDELLIRVGLQNMIHWKEMGLEIIGEAQNGKQGLEIYHQKKPDILLTDIKMPVMDGLELISEIRKEDSVTRIIVLSSYEDFELVHRAFILGISDYILKLKMMPEEMEQVIRNAQSELQKNSKLTENKENNQRGPRQIAIKKMELFILNHDISGKELYDAADCLGIKDKRLWIVIMELFAFPPVMPLIYCNCEEEKKENNEERTLQQVVKNLVENLLSEQQLGVIIAEKDNRFLILMNQWKISNENQCELALREMLMRIHTAIQSCVNKNSVFGISKSTDLFDNLSHSYLEAVEALNQTIFLEETYIFYGKSLSHQKYLRILDDFEMWMDRTGNHSCGYFTKIHEELSLMKRENLMKSRDMKEVVLRWLYWVSYDNDLLIGDAFGKESLKNILKTAEQIRNTASMSDMLKIFQGYLNLANVNKKSAKSLNRELAQATSYIKQHYQKTTLSLTEVANEVSIHKDYLSKLFKKELGIGFSDYVNAQRIKKAQELLQTTHMKSYEISQLVGYTDESYFSRVFKKTVGVRPNEYKRCPVEEQDKEKEDSLY